MSIPTFDFPAISFSAFDSPPLVGSFAATTPFTFIATAEVIALLGAKSVFVDIDEKTWNMNPDLLEADPGQHDLHFGTRGASGAGETAQESTVFFRRPRPEELVVILVPYL
jgi:hypothetical protein